MCPLLTCWPPAKRVLLSLALLLSIRRVRRPATPLASLSPEEAHGACVRLCRAAFRMRATEISRPGARSASFLRRQCSADQATSCVRCSQTCLSELRLCLKLVAASSVIRPRQEGQSQSARVQLGATGAVQTNLGASPPGSELKEGNHAVELGRGASRWTLSSVCASIYTNVSGAVARVSSCGSLSVSPTSAVRVADDVGSSGGASVPVSSTAERPRGAGAAGGRVDEGLSLSRSFEHVADSPSTGDFALSDSSGVGPPASELGFRTRICGTCSCATAPTTSGGCGASPSSDDLVCSTDVAAGRADVRSCS